MKVNPPAIISNRYNSNQFSLKGTLPPQKSIAPDHIQMLWSQFKASGLPPLMTRRSTVTNEFANLKRMRDSSGSETVNQRKSGGNPSTHRRFESVNVRQSQKLAPINSRPGASLLGESSYQSSIARSKAILREYSNNRSTAAGSSIPTLDQNNTNNPEQEENEVIDTVNGQILTRAERKKEYFTKVHQLNDKRRRQWLIKHGKGHVLDFHDDQIRKLRECFNSLDGDGSGSIGIEELEDPLIGLGFAETRQEVQDMIDAVDEDGSGQIEFEEFLTIIKGSNASDKTAKINKFFKDMTTGKLASEGISFSMFVHKMRRDYLKDAIMGDDPSKKEFGEKILKNVQKQFLQQNLSKPTFDHMFSLESPRIMNR